MIYCKHCCRLIRYDEWKFPIDDGFFCGKCVGKSRIRLWLESVGIIAACLLTLACLLMLLVFGLVGIASFFGPK